MGIILSFFVACGDAFNNIFIKKSSVTFQALTIAWAWQFFALIVLIPALLLSEVPFIDNAFWWSTVLKISFYIFSLFLYARALQERDISLAVPMLAFSPAITMVVSYFLNGDEPSFAGIAGVFLILVGAYFLHTKKEGDILAPLISITKNRGVFYMLLVAVLWGITSGLDKTAVMSSGPIWYVAFVSVVISMVLTPIIFLKHKEEFSKAFTLRGLKYLLPVGILGGSMELIQMTAMSLTLAAYVIAIKRSSILISAMLGYTVFKENIRERIFPITVMLLGILLIVLF